MEKRFKNVIEGDWRGRQKCGWGEGGRLCLAPFVREASLKKDLNSKEASQQARALRQERV